MSRKPFQLCVMITTLLTSGCGIFGANHLADSQRYAEIRINDTGGVQVLIAGDEWQGVMNAEGGNGYRHNYYFWAFLKNNERIYANPILYLNYLPQQCRGTLTLDLERKRVTIDVQAPVPFDGNGVYSVKSVTHGPFLFEPQPR